MKKILIFEDEPLLVKVLEIDLPDFGFAVESVTSLPSDPSEEIFRALLGRAKEFDLIVWDAEMSNRMTYDGFIQAFARVFKKPMIANSASRNRRGQQMAAGCTHEVSDKGAYTLVELIISILQ